ncbi:MAG TPA: hypothetical protein PKL57_13960, partial [Candidatus Wallbacteria bacterium]|nr:hypothetical protein [Candidatus Wallbacteria bacterium]
MKKGLFIAIAILMVLATSAFAQTPQSITLKPGFNFIGFTTGISMSPSQFKALNSAIEDVYLFSAAAGSFLSLSEGTLTSLAAGKGYIVKSASASSVTISVSGSALSALGNITLKNGFNLVGFSKEPSTATKFTDLMNTYSFVKGLYKWNAAAGSFIQ